MFKKNFIIAFLTVLLCINSTGASFALDASVIENRYPDYSLEFTGKDTCEKFNRKLFIFNLKLNKFILKPVNIVWASVMPKYGMDRFQSAYSNMNYPIRLMGCLLQKDFKSSKQETIRFLTNTTIGFAGFYDPAKKIFKIEPRQEDMGQVLAHYKMKQGPYLVLPVVQGNLRDLLGKLLDCPLRPTSYAGPFGAAANALFTVNNTAYMQPMVKKVDESFADPYEIAKQVDGISRYIKNLNLDREEVLKANEEKQNITNVSNLSRVNEIKPDVVMDGFSPQGSLVDSMRTALFDNQKIYDSIWAEISVWNRNFGKKIKTSSVNIYPQRPNYKFKYILQKDKASPLAIIYPSIGDGITSDKSLIMAKILYDEGYSVAIQGSSFQWEFVKSMPADYRPGLPAEDAKNLRLVSGKIIEQLQEKNGKIFDKRILVGSSFGGLTGLFVAAQEEKENKLNISKFILISPPVKIFFALDELDKYCCDWKKDAVDIKLRTAIAAEKIIMVAAKISQKELQDMPETMPFSENEAKLIIGFLMKQKLSDVVFAIENCSRAKKNNIYEDVNKMSFYDYADKYLFKNQPKSSEEFDYESSLYCISDYLKKGSNYKIYHSLDDYFVNSKQLAWLKSQSKDKTTIFSNGSHLGFLYRKEFMENFKKEISLKEQKIEEQTLVMKEEKKIVPDETLLVKDEKSGGI